MTGTTEQTEYLDAVRRRYRGERDRRTRAGRRTGAVGVQEAFGYWAHDPWTPRTERAPRHDAVDVLVVGGGFGGLLTAAGLRREGVESVRLVEEGGDVGGTWYWNRYPGIHCDIEAAVYMPLLEEVGTEPTRRYAPGEEIRQHAVALAEHFDLYRDALFHTRITALDWDDDARTWTVCTDQGDRIRARFVVLSSGTLSQPKLPPIPGLESFAGHTFHTSRWDYGYTGGDADGGMTGLHDKRVAVVGTGATGVQVIPMVARDARHLVVLQRTPSSVDVRDNRDLAPGWTRALPAGWQHERMENFLAVVSGEPVDEDLVQDGWTSTALLQRTMLTGARGDDTAEQALADELADARKMDALRRRVTEVVHDPATAAALQPWYRYMCKRPTFSDTYLDTFNRPDVTLVDTADHGGITRVTEDAVVVGDEQWPVDCIVFATGFETGVSGVVSGTLPVRGRGGRPLLEAWAAGPRTLHGVVSHGFPNLFHLGSFQNANAVNFVHVLQEQAEHIIALIGAARDRGARVVEPSSEDEAAWAAHVDEVSVDNGAFLVECTPGYYNGEGARRRGGGGYSPGPVRFHRLLRAWRETALDTVLHDREPIAGVLPLR